MQKSTFHPLDIILYHVGGYGSYGPIDCILESTFSSRCVVVAFEARDIDDEIKTMKEYEEEGIRTLKIPYCVSNRESTQKFHVNNCTLSSGLLPTSEKSAHKDPVYPWGKTWGEVTAVDHIIEVPCITLDSMIQAGAAPAPDLLSIDAQGSELLVLEGAQISVDRDITCIVTEIEFEEIYKGQCLFTDQKLFLDQYEFELMDILNQQFWHPAPAIGKGMLTVGEAVFFKNIQSILKKYSAFTDFCPEAQEIAIFKLIKLAAISFCFERLSYSCGITALLFEKFPQSMNQFFKDYKEYQPLLNLHNYYQKHQHDYLVNRNFFLSKTSEQFINGDPDTALQEFLNRPSSKNISLEDRAHVKYVWHSLLFDLKCKDKGVAIYGNGQHTEWLLEEITGTRGPKIKYILDDNQDGPNLSTYPLICPQDLDKNTIGAIIISSDTYEDEMYEKCRQLYSDSLRIVCLYDDLKN